MELNISQACLYQQNDFISSSEVLQNGGATTRTIKSYRRRFWMLFQFSTISMLSGLLFPEYVSMADVSMCFYGASAEAVNWTSLMWMVMYIVLVFPVSWLMEKMGLKLTVVIGSLCNTLASVVHFATLSQGSFAYVMVTSFFASLSNVLVLSVPPCLAAVWFPSKEVSRACAMGVFGNQFGIALGFVFYHFLIPCDCSHKDCIADGKRNVAIILTSVNVTVLLLVIFTFQKEPKFPPSIAQAEKKDINEPYLESAISMAKNKHFVLVFIMYGLVVGVYFALATLLNYLILSYFPAADVIVGWLGLLVVATGLLGSVIAGYILDHSHKFKETATAICFLSFISFVLFSSFLQINKIWLQFITMGILGFFLTSFLPVGFEYGIEVTYPLSEITSASLLNSSTMIFGIIITETASNILQNVGTMYANAVLCGVLLMATIVSCFIAEDYKRSKKNNSTEVELKKDEAI